jgi:hypothetical protein
MYREFYKVPGSRDGFVNFTKKALRTVPVGKQKKFTRLLSDSRSGIPLWGRGGAMLYYMDSGPDSYLDSYLHSAKQLPVLSVFEQILVLILQPI